MLIMLCIKSICHNLPEKGGVISWDAQRECLIASDSHEESHGDSGAVQGGSVTTQGHQFVIMYQIKSLLLNGICLLCEFHFVSFRNFNILRSEETY